MHVDRQRWKPCVAWVCAMALSLSVVRAGDIKLYPDDPAPAKTEEETSSNSLSSGPRPHPVTPQDGFGVFGRTGHWALGNFGITDPLTHLEAMPYYLGDEHFFFSDLRGFITNYGRVGGNFGAGYRFLDPAFEGWYGGSLWYDVDDSSSRLFQQIGISGELVMPWFELRANGYLPVAQRSAKFADQVGNMQFVGNQLLYRQLTQTGYSLTGADIEAGMPVPLPFLGTQDRLRVFVGGYFFDGKVEDSIVGFKARAEAVINNTVTAQAAFTTDKLFGSQVALGVALEFPWGDAHPSSKWKKNDMPSPFRFVERNYNIILERTQTLGDNLIARDPTTGNPYFFRFVSGAGSAGGNGSFENPFATIAQAQNGATAGDIIFVRSDTVINNGITLASGQRILGDGANHAINLQGFGSALLPILSTAGDMPVVDVVGGPAVTLASNSELSGFHFQNMPGDAIRGTNVSNVTLRNLTFDGVGGDAIHIQSLGGTSNFSNLTFNDIGGNALVVDGGSPELRLSNLTVNDTLDDAVVLANLTNADVTIEGLSITGSQGSGLVLDTLAGTVDVYGATVEDTTLDGIRVEGGTADINFRGSTTIASDLGRGFVLTGAGGDILIDNILVNGAGTGPAISLDHTTGDVTFSNLTIERTGGAGLVGNTISSLTIDDGTIDTDHGAAVDLQNSDNDITLTSINANHTTYGIRLDQTTGSFVLEGDGAAHSGGTIQNTTNAVVLNNAGTVELNWLKLTANQTGVLSTNTTYLGLFHLDATSNVGYAVDALNTKSLFIGASNFVGNGTIGGGTLRVQSNVFGNYQLSIANNTISDANGKAIQILNSGPSVGSSLTMAIRNNTIVSSRDGETMAQIHWNGPLGIEVSGNTFYLNASNMTGFDIRSLSTTSNMSTVITQNTMYLMEAQDTGYSIQASAGSSVEFSSNGLQFNGNNGTGFTFTGVGQSNLYLRNNNLVSTAASGTTGFLMGNLAAGSTVAINSNSLNFNDSSAVVDRGFVFTTLANPVSLQGTQDNILTGVIQPLVIPAGQTTGGFYINSVYQQP